ncbi:MAG TPA: isochorismatase family protein [Pseudonocardia sp.]|jgi:nicotinamidase-related amidase
MKLAAATSALLVIDLQDRLMPAIKDGDQVLANAVRLVSAAGLLDVPVLTTEQNPAGLGATVPALAERPGPTLAKTSFDATEAAGFDELLPPGATAVVIGAEAHVCVLQTVLGLLTRGRRVAVVTDAVGSRTEGNHAAALARAQASGAQLVSTEMVLFEWLSDSTHPRFREVQKLIK